MTRKPEGYALAAAVVAAELATVSIVNPFSGLAYLWFLLIAVTAHRVLIGPVTAEPVLLFAYYAGMALILYFAQLHTLPEYYGFSGGLGVGTDDSRYYSQAADSLPADFPVRGLYYLRLHVYPVLLRLSTPLPIRHPFDILFFNSAGMALLPVLTAQVARRLTQHVQITRLSYVLVLACPIILMNGVVLTRDGVTAALFMGTIAMFLQRRMLAAGILGSLLFYFRIASGLQCIFALGVLSLILLKEYGNIRRQVLFLVTAGVVLAVGAAFTYPIVADAIISSGLLSTGFFRTQIIDTYLSLTPGASTLNQLGSAPAFIRTPIVVAYFLAAPFMGLDQLFVDGVLVPRAVLNTLFALLSIGYIKFFVQGVASLCVQPHTKMRVAALTYLLLIVIVSHLSLVIRHKTMLMPLFYIIVAYGIVRSAKFTVPLGNAAAMGLIGIQIAALMEW